MENAQDKFALRKQYSEFIFDSYNIDRRQDGSIHVDYVYKLGEHTFTPSVDIPSESVTNAWIRDDFLSELFFNFGVINAINYYKLSLAPKFTINCGELDPAQKAFFAKLFYNGLGELMYVNNLLMPFEGFIEINASEPAVKKQFYFNDVFHGNLIPVGGGKDSVVTLEALKSHHAENLCLQYTRDIYPENRAAIDCMQLAGYGADKCRYFNLTLDKHMLELNQQGFYNGHIPFSSCLAFAATIIAYLTNRKNIVLSNEASANEGNVPGTNINHQYSKSIEFENDFRNYSATYLCPLINYFSLLRCYNEYTIVQKFIKFPNYLRVFRSCNVGTKSNSWCGNCAKCLYVYIMLYPFVSQDRLKGIFGRDLLDDTNLGQIFYGLINPDATKPFECVGTREEINYSIQLAIQKANGGKLPALLQWYQTNYQYNPMAPSDVSNYFNPYHNIPKDYLEALQAL